MKTAHDNPGLARELSTSRTDFDTRQSSYSFLWRRTRALRRAGQGREGVGDRARLAAFTGLHQVGVLSFPFRQGPPSPLTLF